ncbi:MAG TPA: family 20 glycosylhydrolase [Candidatus Limnocylindria bacterium]|nr:family 20 glycosylhydrolase [Candidatus Limnocylindria bacterium]
MRILLILNAFFLLAPTTAAQRQRELNLMPMPSSVQLGTGQLPIDQFFSVAVTGFQEATLERGVQRFVAELSQQTGILLKHKPADASPTLSIHADHGREPVQKLGEDESYELAITDSGAKLTAPTPLGILYGLQTFLQLVETTPAGFALPAVTIKDKPRFPWRGLLIDVGRHFIPLDVLKRNVDGMAAVKLNVLHLHLSDDQGFRVESKRFPKLHEMGSDGMYYTQGELRDLVSYAHDRGIRVLPEFDTPGHSRSWFVGYPELASNPGPYKVDPEGPDSVTDPTQEGTYKFLEKFVDEMAKLFPDAYFHIGGDEVDGKHWDANPKIQAFIHSHGMKNNQDLQAYFNQRLQKILTKHHKLMVGWDEILHPDLPKTIVIHSWRGQESLATAAKQGYSGLLSFGYYIDLMWPAARHYAVDPMSGAAATLSPEEKSRILGGEACMWTEWVTPEILDSRVWPRTAAIAERLWSPQEVTDVGSMYARLAELNWRLDWLGLKHRTGRFQMLHRMSGTEDISALRTLADVVEPVKDYARISNVKGPWDFRAPLNHLIDAVSPESDAARHFRDQVQAYMQSGCKDQAAEAQVRMLLTTWRDNDMKLRPLLQRSFLLLEVTPLSQDLSALGAAGLQALDYLDKSEPGPESWRAQQLALIERARTPRADLLLLVVAPVQQLIEASAGQTQK